MFGYGYYRKSEKTDNERYLEDELERHHQAEERRNAEEERQRNARRQEVQEQFLWDERHASSWPEALRKKQVLFIRREANQWVADEFPDNYFAPGANACERALEIWEEEEKNRQADVEALRARLEAIDEEVRLSVADRLESESDLQSWVGVAQAIRGEDYNNWLWWRLWQRTG